MPCNKLRFKQDRNKRCNIGDVQGTVRIHIRIQAIARGIGREVAGGIEQRQEKAMYVIAIDYSVAIHVGKRKRQS